MCVASDSSRHERPLLTSTPEPRASDVIDRGEARPNVEVDDVEDEEAGSAVVEMLSRIEEDQDDDDAMSSTNQQQVDVTERYRKNFSSKSYSTPTEEHRKLLCFVYFICCYFLA